MKKMLLGLVVVTLGFTLVGCSSGNDETTSSLQEENASLKKENTKLKKQVKASKALLEELVGVSDSSDAEDSNTDSTDSHQMNLNEAGSFQSGEKITVISIEDNTSLQLNENNVDEHPVVVTTEVENTGTSPIDFNAQSFDLYDADSQMGRFDSSTYGNNVPNSVAAGKKATVVIHFAAKGTGPYSVSFGDATWEQ